MDAVGCRLGLEGGGCGGGNACRIGGVSLPQRFPTTIYDRTPEWVQHRLGENYKRK